MTDTKKVLAISPMLIQLSQFEHVYQTTLYIHHTLIHRIKASA